MEDREWRGPRRDIVQLDGSKQWRYSCLAHLLMLSQNTVPDLSAIFNSKSLVCSFHPVRVRGCSHLRALYHPELAIRLTCFSG